MKKLLVLIFAAMLILVLVGCGGHTATPAPATQPAAPTEPIPTTPPPTTTPEPTPTETTIETLPELQEQTASENDIPPSSTYTGDFDMAGMWLDQTGTILTFNPSGAVGPMLFGFEGGPDGSWMISSRMDENGHYTLQASHITGGSPIFKVRVISYDEVELHAESGVEFGRSFYHLIRQ